MPDNKDVIRIRFVCARISDVNQNIEVLCHNENDGVNYHFIFYVEGKVMEYDYIRDTALAPELVERDMMYNIRQGLKQEDVDLALIRHIGVWDDS